MVIKDRIPEDFYKIFRTKNTQNYIDFLLALYDENNKVYTSLGLTISQCKVIISQIMDRKMINWEPEVEENEDSEQYIEMSISAATVVTRFINWGWLRSEYDEKLNEYIISFPQYSRMYIELFKELGTDDSERERENMLSVYSCLYTYLADKDRNNDILKNAVKTSVDLSQLMSNMLDSMRIYFDELSSKKDFIGVQEILVNELNNSDSKRYAILTTTDSFYRYKESVKELLSDIIIACESDASIYRSKLKECDEDSKQAHFLNRKIQRCEQATTLVYRIQREFNVIEIKYNRLIEFKTTFAKRALARIHYILSEGIGAQDNVMKLVSMYGKGQIRDDFFEKLSDNIFFTTQFKNINDDSFAIKSERTKHEFKPVEVTVNENEAIADYVKEPLYSKSELDEFAKKNIKDGVLYVDENGVKDVDDLEKLMFVWQRAVYDTFEDEDKISYDGEVVLENGMKYSKLRIDNI